MNYPVHIFYAWLLRLGRTSISCFFILTGLFASNNAQAQGTFSCSPDAFDEVHLNQNLNDGFLYFQMESFLYNTGTDTIQVDWDRVLLDVPPQWDIFISDINISYPPNVDSSHIPVTLYPGPNEAFFSATVFPNQFAGCAHFMVIFSDLGSGLALDTIQYTIKINDSLCIASGLDSRFVQPEPVKLYPNPVSNTASIQSGLEYDQWFVSDLLGRIVLDRKSDGSSEFDFSALPKGSFILHLFHNGLPHGQVSFIKL
ncbi:MAG: T9SS type A sorting domain-containing protein [Saprospiraceae bacterium]